MSVETTLQALRLEPRFMRNVARWEIVPATGAACALPTGLDPQLLAVLAGRGITALYTHQADAVAAALRGEHAAIVTPAASGKTLCYNLPVLNHLLADPRRALYLFPTKALAQDQLAELRGFIELLSQEGDVGVSEYGSMGVAPHTSTLSHSYTPAPLYTATYDGDTPSAQRAKVRDAARIILSNPDMLHAGILPQHPRWAGSSPTSASW